MASSQTQDKLYELRMYEIKPMLMSNYIQLTRNGELYPSEHSKRVGHWRTEIGCLHEAVYLWEYDSLADREDRREYITGDNEWKDNDSQYIVPMVKKQTTVLLKLLPWSNIEIKDQSKLKDKIFFELERITLKDGIPRADDDSSEVKIYTERLASRPNGPELAGAFFSILGGVQDTIYLIWCYKSLSDITTIRSQHLEAVSDLKNHISDRRTKLLKPVDKPKRRNSSDSD